MDPQLSNSNLTTKYGFTNLGLFVFIQRWTELFDYKTIDSYQFHVRNSYWIIKEILDTISLVRSGTIYFANLPPLISEARDRVLNDLCLQKNAPALRGRLISNLEKPPKSDDKAALIRLEYQLQHALNYISPKYLEWLLTDIKEAIDNDELEKTEVLTSILATELVNIGWSPRSLSRLVKHVCFLSNTGSLNDMWRNFIHEIKAPVQTFKFYCLCRGNNIQLLMDSDITIREGSDIISEYPQAAPHVSPTSKYMHMNSVARFNDVHSAVENSKQYLSKVQALISYNAIDAVIENSLLVIFPGGQKCTMYNIKDTTWKCQI